MTKFRLTEDFMTVKGTLVYRIQAVEDMDDILVKEDELGGYVCRESTLLDNAWVANRAIVINSTLSGNVKVEDDALLEDCELTGDCYIHENAHLTKVKGYGLYAANYAKVADSEIACDIQDKYGVQLLGNSHVVDTRFKFNGTYALKGIVVKDDAFLRSSIVQGWNIQIEGRSVLSTTQVSGSNIYLMSAKGIVSSDITGDGITLADIERFKHSTVIGSQLEISEGAAVSYLKLTGKQINIKGRKVDLYQVEIHGERILIDACVEMIQVVVKGLDIHLTDYVSLIGLEEDPLTIGSQVKMEDAVCFHIEPGKRAPELKNEHITGDFTYTGR